MQSDEVEYKIFGDDMQLVSVILDPRESVVAEAGALMYMPEGIAMKSIVGDGSKENQGFLDKMLGMGTRILTGESLLMTIFTNCLNTKSYVTFAAPYPGKILPVDLSKIGNKIICQKDAFLCAAKGVSVGMELTKRFGAGFFGGEGFILEKLEGDGLAFIHAGGTLVKKELKPNEKVKVDTGCLVAMTQNVDYDIEMVRDIKTTLFGGEGLFLATLTGPGTVWLQSLPFSRMADKIISASRYGLPSRSVGQSSSSSVGDLIGGVIDSLGN